ncbi:MAG: DUF3467 domain-containing protein [Elusimicrobia bacterium]|nr:DUF3467 domain-containing protein [Elusimicrobiota bacterium]
MSEEKKIQIGIGPEEEKGLYANLVLISHTKEEFVFDFAFIQPQRPAARVVKRIVMSPAHVKRFVGALSENIKRYEGSFGSVSPSEERKIGF